MSETKIGKVSITPKGTWDSTATYEQLDMVSYGGGSWIAKKTSTGVTPRENDCWMQAAEKGDKGADATSTTSSTYVIPRNTSSAIDVNMLSLCPWAAGNKFAFIPPANVVVEETTDGGETWTVQTVSDAAKRFLFGASKSSTTSNVSIPLLDGKQSPLCGTRITISALNYKVPDGTTDETRMSYWTVDNFSSVNRYVSIDGIFAWVNTSGSAGINFTMEAASGKNPTVWKNVGISSTLRGWDGGNFVRVNNLIFGAYVANTDNIVLLRLNFFTEKASGGGKQWISYLSAIGANAWGEQPNSIIAENHLYSVDSYGNARFPANLTAAGTLFEKNVETIESISITEDVTSIERSVSATKLFVLFDIPSGAKGTLAIEVTLNTGAQYIQYYNYAAGYWMQFEISVRNGVLDVCGRASSSSSGSSSDRLLSLPLSAKKQILSGSSKSKYITGIRMFNATIPAGSTVDLFAVKYE